MAALGVARKVGLVSPSYGVYRPLSHNDLLPGSLAAAAATSDIVDACVVEGALPRHDLVVSSDEADLHVIAAAASQHHEVDRP